MDDDFYLMKLMTKTGTCWDKLHESTAEVLKQRIQEIFKSGFLDSLRDQWIGQEAPENHYAVDYFETDDKSYPNDVDQISFNQEGTTESEIQSLIGRYNIRANS